MQDTSQVVQLVHDEGQRLGLGLEPPIAQRLAQYVTLLSRWSRRIRLTADPGPAAIVQRHLGDALMLAELIPRTPPIGRCVDVGAGGGLPGLPCLLLRPDLTVTLVETNGRKCSFLRSAKQELGLACEVMQTRVETLEGHVAAGEAEGFDLGWSRATFPPQNWLDHAAALVRSGGHAVVLMSSPLEMQVPAFELFVQRAYELADGTPRVIALYRKR